MTSPAIVRLQTILIAELEAICAARTRELVASALGRLRPVNAQSTSSVRVEVGKADANGYRPVLRVLGQRRKAPIQLCPAPGCTSRAAPVFGMLCASHKDADKATVRAWREQRRAAKGR